MSGLPYTPSETSALGRPCCEDFLYRIKRGRPAGGPWGRPQPATRTVLYPPLINQSSNHSLTPTSPPLRERDRRTQGRSHTATQLSRQSPPSDEVPECSPGGASAVGRAPHDAIHRPVRT